DESSLPSFVTATAAQKLAALLLSLPDSVGAEIASCVLTKLEGRQLTDVVFEMNQMGKSIFLPARLRTLREFFDYYHGSSQSFLYPGQTQAEIERLTLKNPERVARCIKLFWIEQGAIVREVFKTLAEHHPTRLGKAILEFWEAVQRNRMAVPSSRKAAAFLGGCHPEVKEEIEKHLGGDTIKTLDSFSAESAPPLHQVQMEFLKHYYLLYQEEIRHSTL
ncbi:MAG: hypothetical protein HYU64_11730, partial [Armatimonadetes bacterium]|nr:hypothetical protein [Armatimonadota bacterium]